MANSPQSLSAAIDNAISHAQENPEYVNDILRPIQSFFQVNAVQPSNQVIFAAVIDALGIPVRFAFNEKTYGQYAANMSKDIDDFHVSDEHIEISTMFYELLKNKEKYGVKNAEAEMVFIYAHELYHARFRHLQKQKILSKDYPMPHVVYNVVFDILINTLLKYNEPLVKKAGGDMMNLVMFQNSMRYYPDIQSLKNNRQNAKDTLETYGIEVDDQELIDLNILANKNIEKLTDDELAQVFYKNFKEFFEPYQQCFDEAMQEAMSGGSGQPNEEDEDGEGSEGSGGGEEDNNGDGARDEILDNFDKKLKERAENDPEFAEAMKKFISNFSGMPSPEMQVTMEAGLKGGVMTPKEIAEAVRGQQSVKQVVEEAEEKFAGQVPGMLRSFGDIKPKRPSYLSQLQSFGNKHIGDTRRTYSPPNKKQIGRRDLIIPSKVGNALDIAFVIDTSGSMSSSEITPVLGQIKAILRKSPNTSNMHILFNDATFQHEVVKGRNMSKFQRILSNGVQGSGGSVFDEVFKHKAIKKVDAVIFLSDFYIFIPDDLKIRKPVVVLYTQDHNKDVLKEFMNRSKYSMSAPAGRLD